MFLKYLNNKAVSMKRGSFVVQIFESHKSFFEENFEPGDKVGRGAKSLVIISLQQFLLPKRLRFNMAVLGNSENNFLIIMILGNRP